MSRSQSHSSMSPGTIDPLDLLDLSEYGAYQSPALSPVVNKTPVLKQEQPLVTPTTIPSSQSMSGPSHQYDLYRQQTGFVPGAVASTLSFGGGYNSGLDYLTGLSPDGDVFDFNTAPSQGSLDLSDMDLDFSSPSGDAAFLFDTTISPSSVNNTTAELQRTPSLTSPPTLLSTTTAASAPVARAWPGMHQQAALAKAQARQQQQQQIIHQQRQRQQQQQQPSSKTSQATDPIVEQKIAQVLNMMRAQSAASSDGSFSGQQAGSPTLQVPRPKKDEDDMDEDERLLASEEGKKLSSKERRQLRNKVSARAFRSRRKEYITQLEAEIANKVTENGDLRSQNRALADENRRLSDLTRMLLSSPSFSNFLDQLSSNPSMLPQPAPQVVESAPTKPEATSRSASSQIPKDVNPFAAQQQLHRVGMAIIPEQTIDFTSLTLDGADAFTTFQPQVYTAIVDPCESAIDVSVLAGKSSNYVEHYESDVESKIDVPAIELPPMRQPEKAIAPEAPQMNKNEVEDDEDPIFDLYRSSSSSSSTTTPVELDTDSLSPVDIFGGIESEKVLARYELVDASEEEKSAALAMARFHRLTASVESVVAKLEMLTMGL